ncbi:MAG: DEAD/DEAH box helicase family protein, partial [Leptospira sp.]|nr:DEAD/DEAH box helicase family protein [Leptospira sp.]
LEHDSNARILVITDRDELDRQITNVMQNSGVIGKNDPSPRIINGNDFKAKLTATTPRLLCALINKFNVITALDESPPSVYGSFYVFVDECHRSQSGTMHQKMKNWLPNAIFIGFTGTPLLKSDKPLTRAVFGTPIHTYKFPQAVEDKVVLDLIYEARKVPQRLSSRERIDEWFDVKTQTLNRFQRAKLRERWASMEKLMSSEDRKSRIVASIIHDFGVRPRLNNDRGTAILVSASIYEACHYFNMFRSTNFGSKCGIITSFEPNAASIASDPQGSESRYKFDTYTKFVLTEIHSTEKYEQEVKRRFIHEPANMKLLIVVSKLLTGFDAPSCTYIYLDNELRDHNLFQAICRTNRLDGDDKDFGYIVDFKELFGDVQDAIALYSSDELDTEGASEKENNINLKNWREAGKKQLEDAKKAIHYLCAPIPPPKELEQFIQHFCGDITDPESLNQLAPLRVSFYKSVALYVRCYANVAEDLKEVGYSDSEIEFIKKEIDFYVDIRDSIKKCAGEELDTKPYEADMRHLINTYILADDSRRIGSLEEMTLLDLIVKTGIHDAIAKKFNEKGRKSKRAVSEGIIRNIRKTIIRESLIDPRFYEEMSKLLSDLIKQQRENEKDYEKFLKNAEDLVKKLSSKRMVHGAPAVLFQNREATVLFNNLPGDDIDLRASLALELDSAIRNNAPAGWKGDQAREAQVQNSIFPILSRNRELTERIFEIVKNQPGY